MSIVIQMETLLLIEIILDTCIFELLQMLLLEFYHLNKSGMEIVDTTPLMTLIKFSRNRDRAILKLFFIDLGVDSVRSIHLCLCNCSIWCMIWDVMPSRRLRNNPTDEGHIEQGISDLTCHIQSGRGAPC